MTSDPAISSASSERPPLVKSISLVALQCAENENIDTYDFEAYLKVVNWLDKHVGNEMEKETRAFAFGGLFSKIINRINKNLKKNKIAPNECS
ncbi:uncharacterized protein LOC111619881 isoform X2 [Centruroides sculpturatus]|nr:uncharacterized protein LOC111619881 isoform X2 [Centruroides sculpturatus]